MKTVGTILTAAFILLPWCSAQLLAQTKAEAGEKKIVITKRSVEADGSEVTETIIKRGQAAESFDVEEFIRENEQNNTQVEVRIESASEKQHIMINHDSDHKFDWQKELGQGACWATGDNQRAFLGVEEDSDEKTAEAGLVIEVVCGSAAELAGLKTNDVILTLNDKPINQWSDLSSFISAAKAGDKVRISYSRGGQAAMAEATLTTRADVKCDQEKQRHGFLGLSSDDDDDDPGVKVEVVDESGAQKAGLLDGDVIFELNNVKISDFEDVSDVMSSVKPGDAVRISYEREGKRQQTSATAGEQKTWNWGEWDREDVMEDFNIEEKQKPACLGVYTHGVGAGDQQGASVDNFMEESAARESQMAVGDVITGVNGTRVKNHDELWKEIASYQPGDKVKVDYLRKSQMLQVEATLKACQSKETKEAAFATPHAFSIDVQDKPACLGVFTEATGDDAGAGANINDFTEESAAREAQMMVGDVITGVNGTRVKGHDDLWNEIARYQPGEKIAVSYMRNDQPLQIEATLKACRNNSNKVLLLDTEEGDQQGREFFIYDFDEDDRVSLRQRRVITIHRGNDGDSPKVDPAPAAADHRLALETFRAYPNPTQGQITVEFNTEAVPTIVSLFDIGGRQLFREELNAFNGEYNQQFDLSEYAKGAIIVHVQQGDKVFTEQIVVQ